MDEKRKFPRFPVTASVICSRYGRQMTMRTLDISQGGLKLEANFELGVGESMDFVILINGTRIRCRGKILAIEEINHKVQARLRFTRTSSSEQRKLSNHLQSLSISPFQKRLIGGLLILALVAASLIVITTYTQYFHSGPDRGPLGERERLKDDSSATQAPAFKMGPGVEAPKAGQRAEKEGEGSIGFSGATVGPEGGIREGSDDLAVSRMQGVGRESDAETQAIQDTSGDLRLSRLEERESAEVSKTQAEIPPPSDQETQEAAVIKEGALPGVSRPEIRRSAIALGVEGREPVGISQRVSVGQGQVYCWMHVVNGKGSMVTVRWIGMGRIISEVHLRIGSSSWRTWSYISLMPSMIGPVQAEIRDENGEILETLSVEITE